MEELLISLESVLVNDDYEKIEEKLKHVLRESFKRRILKITAGSYQIDFDPRKISVVYENPNTYIKVADNDIYYETERENNVRYFIISNDKKDQYDIQTPCIKVQNYVVSINGEAKENYYIELLAEDETIDLKNYLKDVQNFNEVTSFDAEISREVSKNSNHFDLMNLFDEKNIIPVTYSYFDDCFINYQEQKDKDYEILLPDVTNQINKLKKIFFIIIDFYKEYSNQ